MSAFYKYLFLPVDKPLTDGCWIINQSGEPFVYDETRTPGWNPASIRVAEPWLVCTDFNLLELVGQVSPKVKWLKPGDEVKKVDCSFPHIWDDAKHCFVDTPEPGKGLDFGFTPYVRIKCPMCGDLH